jgi:hypothetical protein
LAVDKLTSATICERLGKLEERPWAEWGKAKKPITAPSLAKLLTPFDIKPKTVWLKDRTTAKGYDLADFEEAFDRYLAPPSAEGTASEPSGRQDPHGSRAGESFRAVRSEDGLTAEETREPLGGNDPDDLTDEEATSDSGRVGPGDTPPTELF